MTPAAKNLYDRYTPAGMFVVFLCLLASRRWAQFTVPQVWDEESWVIDGFIKHGWLEIFHPINGYLLMVPKIMVGAALATSFHEFPAISMALSWSFTALVGVAIAFSPTHLKGRMLCALAVFAVPSDPEVFGITLYTFWWAALLLFLLAVWDERKPAPALRLLFLFAGGLSSPVIVALLPVFYFRAYWFRAMRTEKWLAVIATVVAAIQFYFTRTVEAGQFPPLGSIAAHVIPKFLGSFLVGNLDENRTLAWLAGLAVLALVLICTARARRSPGAWVVLFLLVAAIGLSVARMDPAIPHLRLAGPRYFFFPFVATFWAVIQGLHAPQQIQTRILAGAMLALALVNAVPAWARGVPQDDLRWADHVRSAVYFSEYAIPIQFDGSRFRPWPPLRQPQEVWVRVLDASRLLPSGGQSTLPTFAYRVLDSNDHGPGVIPAGVVLSPPHSIDSSVSAISGKQEIRLQLKRGDRIHFKSGPNTTPSRMRVIGREGSFIEDLPLTENWVALEFSHSKLPAEFTLSVQDEGNGVGQWAFLEGGRTP